MSGRSERDGSRTGRFAGKVALVTGAASGIGRATALRLAEESAALVVCDVQSEALEQTAKDARELGAEAVAQLCDVTDPAAARAAVTRASAEFGRLDVLCNVAGILHWHHSHELPLEVWNRVMEVNVTGTFLVTQAAIPALLETGGNVVTVSSTAALAGQAWTLAYSASKGAVLSMMKTLAVEYAEQGIRFNAVCPANIETPIQETFQLPEGANPKLLRRITSLSKARPPEDCASVIAFLASNDAIHVNGEHVRVDGATLS
jgi:meso-butanediol dehydrogenase/(S,S)-butanediol dehydrogenase/diacetyl reductase